VNLFNKPAPRLLAILFAVLKTLLPDSFIVVGSASDDPSLSGFVSGSPLVGSGLVGLLSGVPFGFVISLGLTLGFPDLGSTASLGVGLDGSGF